MSNLIKPIGRKAYGHIPHLPGSRMGAGDHHCSPGQGVICCEKARDKRDRIIVQEKVDGSCCAVARVDGALIPLSRSGFCCWDSTFETHRDFALWVNINEWRFDGLLKEGERVVGEWIGHAVGTVYKLRHLPFVAFDLMQEEERLPTDETRLRCEQAGLVTPRVLSDGPPCSIERAMQSIRWSGHGASEDVEGAVWRVERDGKIDFLAKFVRHEKQDGKYLPGKENAEVTAPVLNIGLDSWLHRGPPC